MTNDKKDTLKIRKCMGIPMYPKEYHFDMERPEGITDEHIESKCKNVDRFFERNGFILPRDACQTR